MVLHVYSNPSGTRDASDGVNVWVTEVPADFSDADVRWNVEKWAADGDRVAALALQLVAAHGQWFDYGAHVGRTPRTERIYVDR